MAEKKNKVMLINVTHSEESRLAILSGGTLDAFEIETFDHRSTKGNIYKGRIETVHVGLGACFVDIGEERAAFLPLDEVNFKVHPARKDTGKGRIENHLQRGQELLVQVVRDAYGSKPPTLSTYFSLPGRYLVLTPFDGSQGISRKLSDKARERIRSVLESLPVPEGFGIIARTAGGGATKLEMQRDLKYLLRLWEKIDEASRTRAPKLIYQERSLVIRTIRDLYSPEISEILVDDEATCREIEQFFDVVLPHKKKTVKHYTGDRPIFNKHNLEEQIENIFRRRVPLASGGALVFDTTEALTSIDVNSSRMKQEGHIEDTAFKANYEAAEEIGRQLRLRDLGGLIVIDFIDMRASKNVRAIEKVMKDSLKRDKARYDMTRISRLGLMEISRQRLNPNKTSLRYTDCPHCEGTGSIKTVEAAALQALRRLQTRIVRGDLENVEVVLPPDVAAYILNHKRLDLAGWERRYRTQVIVRGDEEFKRDECELDTVIRPKIAGAAPVVAAPVHDEILAELEHEPEDAAEPEEAEDTVEVQGENGAGVTKKRRRRRRRRKSRSKSGATEEAVPAASNGSEEDVEGGTPREIETGEREQAGVAPAGAVAVEQGELDAAGDDGEAAADEGDGFTPAKKRRRRRRRRRKPRSTAAEEAVSAAAAVEERADAEGSTAVLPPLAAPIVVPERKGEPARAQWWKQLIGSV